MSSPPRTPSVLCGLLLAFAFSALCLDCTPRKRILYDSNSFKVFHEEGIWNYTSMLMREDLGILILGAREAIYALDLNDISVATAKVTWQVTQEKQKECTYKGKHPDIECRNYIRTLHPINETVMYVCGTNAFNPVCDYIAYVDGHLKLEGRQEEGKGKCPFDPFQRYSSIMIDKDLYSATVLNFLGSEPVVLRSGSSALRTEFKSSWLSEPNFIYMDLITESKDSPEGDDDKIYMFFSENAVEYDFYNKLVVSRVARVCKGDRGGQRTLQRKWTSFLKASLDCPVPGNILPYVIQDVFHVRHSDWRKSTFFAVFTSQSGSSDVSSVVCSYSVVDIDKVFSHGKYKTPVTVDTSHVKWVMYSGELPVPRPGACINGAARDAGIQSSLNLPDKTLQFIRDRPLMDDSVKPLTGKPLLVRRGTMFTRLAVDRVTALDGQSHLVMFIGTDNGFVQKAVNYEGEMHIIEELQLFERPEAVGVLRLSDNKGQLYVGSASGVVQMPVADCSRYSSCFDCVLARDPYCVWDLSTHHCTTLPSPSEHGDLVQSLKEGDATRCPEPGPVMVRNRTLVLGNNIRLPCHQDSSLAQLTWQWAAQYLDPSSRKYSFSTDGLLIFNTSASDAGRYTCKSVEEVAGRQYETTLAIYELKLPSASDDEDHTLGVATTEQPLATTAPSTFPTVDDPESSYEQRLALSSKVALQVSLAVVSAMMAALLLWNFYKGHLPLLRCCRAQTQKQHRLLTQKDSTVYTSHPDTSENLRIQVGINLRANDNHRNGANTGALKCAMDESEI